MTSAQLLIDAFGRIRDVVHEAAGGLTPPQLAHRIGEGANPIGWLVWHLTRVQDDHIADAAGTEQVWTAGGWADRFGLPLDTSDIGYGHTGDEVEAVRIESAELLTAYHDAVRDRTVEYLGPLTGDDLDRVIDHGWDPPVTLGVRLISVVSDDLQHAGQATFVRGLLPDGPPAG